MTTFVFWAPTPTPPKLQGTICNRGHIHKVKTYSDNCVPSHRDHFHVCDHLQAILLYPSHHASGAAEGPDGTRLRAMLVCLILVDWDWTSRRHLCPALPGVMALCKCSSVRKTHWSRTLVMWLGGLSQSDNEWLFLFYMSVYVVCSVTMTSR